MKKKQFNYRTIKTYEHACGKIGIDPIILPDVSQLDPGMGKTLIAIYKLMVIFKAINDGWEPNWNNSSEYKYFPWFSINSDSARPSGFGFSFTFCGGWFSLTNCGSRLCTNSRDKALYIANTFEAEYIDFILISQ